MAHLRSLLTVLASAVASAVPQPSGALAPHPRLLTDAKVAEIQAAIAEGGDATGFSSLLFSHADWVVTQPVVPRGVPDATGILVQTRTAIDYLLTCALAHRLNATTPVYLDRAIAEALNLAVTWSDWNPVQHALDTGEAMFGVSNAYDWLYTHLNASVQDSILQGIISKGLAPYRQYVPNRTVFWWVNNTINWNCVCSSGGITAVLATYGDAGAPGWAWDDVLSPLVSGVVPCIGAYNADASWEEGPGYWGYASKYTTWNLVALQNAVNTTYGLADIPGVPLAARFPIYSTGADAIRGSGNTFDWADSHSGFEWTPFSQWWGTAFGDAAAAFYSRLGTKSAGPASITSSAWAGFVEALFFYTPLGTEADVAALPTAKLYDVINMAVFRGPWDAETANQTYLGLKGGDNAWNHAHLDLGSFVYDYAGARFAEDMGGDSYELPGYFDDKVRWSYYRMSSRGHNLVLFGNESQAFPAQAAIIAFSNASSQVVPGTHGSLPIAVDGWAVVNLTAAYASTSGVSSYLRGFVSLSSTNAVIVVDEWVYPPSPSLHPANMTWQLHTQAQVGAGSRGGGSASAPPTTLTLTAKGGQVAALAVLDPLSSCPGYAGFTFTDLATVLPDPPFDSAAGYTRVDAVVQDPSTASAPCTALRVVVGQSGIVAALAAGSPTVRPIAEWGVDGPLAA